MAVVDFRFLEILPEFKKLSVPADTRFLQARQCVAKPFFHRIVQPEFGDAEKHFLEIFRDQRHIHEGAGRHGDGFSRVRIKETVFRRGGRDGQQSAVRLLHEKIKQELRGTA